MDLAERSYSLFKTGLARLVSESVLKQIKTIVRGFAGFCTIVNHQPSKRRRHTELLYWCICECSLDVRA